MSVHVPLSCTSQRSAGNFGHKNVLFPIRKRGPSDTRTRRVPVRRILCRLPTLASRQLDVGDVCLIE